MGPFSNKPICQKSPVSNFLLESPELFCECFFKKIQIPFKGKSAYRRSFAAQDFILR